MSSQRDFAHKVLAVLSDPRLTLRHVQHVSKRGRLRGALVIPKERRVTSSQAQTWRSPRHRRAYSA